MTDAKPYTLAECEADQVRLRATVEALERAEQERDCWKAICGREDGYHPLHVREAVRLLDMEKCRAAASQTSEFINGMQDEREEQRARAERAEAALAAVTAERDEATSFADAVHRRLEASRANVAELSQALAHLADVCPCNNGCDAADMTCAQNKARAALADTTSEAWLAERLAAQREACARVVDCGVREDNADTGNRNTKFGNEVRATPLVNGSDSWLAEVRATARDEALEEASIWCGHSVVDASNMAASVRANLALKRGGK